MKWKYTKISLDAQRGRQLSLSCFQNYMICQPKHKKSPNKSRAMFWLITPFFQFKTKAVQIQTGAVSPFLWKLDISWKRKMNKHGIKMQFWLLLSPLHIMGLIDSPICKRCEADEEISARVMCECEAFAALRHTYLDSFILDPEDVRSLSRGAIWNLLKEQGSYDLDISLTL
jgi:hypothetical protein